MTDQDKERIEKGDDNAFNRIEWETAVDPEGYAIAAIKILHELKLVIGEHVNEFAMPVIIQIMKNNIRGGKIEGFNEGTEYLQTKLDKIDALCTQLNDQDKEISELKIQLSNYAYERDMAIRQRDVYANEINDLKAEIYQLKEKLY